MLGLELWPPVASARSTSAPAWSCLPATVSEASTQEEIDDCIADYGVPEGMSEEEYRRTTAPKATA